MITRGRRAPRVADPVQVVAVDRSWIGTPYHDQASTKGVGCDCLGLIAVSGVRVVGAEPGPLPPYSRDGGGDLGARSPARGRRTHLIEVPLATVAEAATVGSGTACAGAAAVALVLFRIAAGAPSPSTAGS